MEMAQKKKAGSSQQLKAAVDYAHFILKDAYIPRD